MKKSITLIGNVDADGIPFITVVADGQWFKRSYRTKYDAFSGVVSYVLKYVSYLIYFF